VSGGNPENSPQESQLALLVTRAIVARLLPLCLFHCDWPARYISTVQFDTTDSSIQPTKLPQAEGGTRYGDIFSITA